MPKPGATKEEQKSAVIDALAEITSGTSEDDTIKLRSDVTSYGIVAPENSNFTLDLGGHTLDPTPDANGDYAGSSGTKTQAMQLLKGSTIVIKDGKITGNPGDSTTDPVTPPTKMVIQNYSNLTLDNTVVEDGGTDLYALSNNFGEIHLKNGTKIIAKDGHVAFDLWYGMNKVYDAGVTVWIDTKDVKITGPIEFGHASRIKDESKFLEKTHLYVCGDYEDISALNVVSPPGSSVEYEFVKNEDIGYYELVPKTTEEPVSDTVEG